MILEKKLPLLEEILKEWKQEIGEPYPGYKNHVYRMIHFCLTLFPADRPATDEEKEKIIIAGCFHDMGLWTENTLDYLPPSIVLARDYLKGRKLEHWSAEIELMIDMHHKLRPYKNESYPLVELFRKGDLVDFSLGLVKFGISRDYIKKVKATFPNAGFHKTLVKRGTKWFLRHPLNPAPIFRW